MSNVTHQAPPMPPAIRRMLDRLAKVTEVVVLLLLSLLLSLSLSFTFSDMNPGEWPREALLSCCHNPLPVVFSFTQLLCHHSKVVIVEHITVISIQVFSVLLLPNEIMISRTIGPPTLVRLWFQIILQYYSKSIFKSKHKRGQKHKSRWKAKHNLTLPSCWAPPSE